MINKVTQSFKFCTTTFLLAALLVSFLPSKSYAEFDGGLGRERTCNADGRPEGLDWNPTDGGKDVQFVLDNPVCISVIAFAYATTKISLAAMNNVCKSGSSVPRILPSPTKDVFDITKATVKAAVNKNGACGVAIGVASAQLGITLGILSTIYGIATIVNDETKICGGEWVSPNPKQYINNLGSYKSVVEAAVNGYIKAKQTNLLSLNNKTYREGYYGGVEVVDSPASGSACPDVTQNKGFDGNYPSQVYYMKGLETANYRCNRFSILPGQKDPRDGKTLYVGDPRLAEYKAAYDCCKYRAREFVCIDYSGSRKFCHVGENCDIDGITFTAKSRDNGSLACAQTYSLCPYNFFVGGGAEFCNYYQDGIYNSSTGLYTLISVSDVASQKCGTKSEIRNEDCSYNTKAGRCKNYCQYLTHCTKTDLSNYIYASSITSPYFSYACLNFTGDSQNQVSYGTGFIAGSARHFSAPIAQCVKETIENVFYNRAGHTQCIAKGDTPTSAETCAHGGIYKIGDQVQENSFFKTIQDQMLFFVKLILTFAIIIYGGKTLIGGGGIKKSEILIFLLKIGLVMYFATGSAWKDSFFDGIYGASTTFAQIVFKIQTDPNPNKRDGCQFGDISVKNDDGTVDLISTSTYPAGKEYLAIFDTIDCKMARYLGFGPEVSTANIAKLILAGYITGTIGIYFSMALLFFGLMMIAIAIRMLHIFLSSALAIIIMVYVSPLVIPLVLFKKTEGIFKGWVKQIISFSLQPMILFAYIAILVSIMDQTLIGSATFYGITPFRTISCADYCKNTATESIVTNSPNCDRVNEILVQPKVDSIACMVSNNYFSDWPGLDIIGISLPFIIDFFVSHPREKILTLAKAFLVMYFLWKFMDEIPEITSELLGGSSLPTSKSDPTKMFKNITSVLKGVQKRAMRGGVKGVKGVARGGAALARGVGESASKGKSVGKDEGGSTPSGSSHEDSGSSGSSKTE